MEHNYIEELRNRCMYESVEFLYKSGIVETDSTACRPVPSHLVRAHNLFCMKEYYQVVCVLACNKQSTQYNYCTCCSTDAVFLRNYALYILASIKREEIQGIVVEGQEYGDAVISKHVQNAISMNEHRASFLDSAAFRDPYLVYLLLMTKKNIMTDKARRKCTVHVIKHLPLFWDVYKVLCEVCTIWNIERYTKHIDSASMRAIFYLYMASKKCIMFPQLEDIMSTVERTGTLQRVHESAFVQSMIAAVLGHQKKTKKAIKIFEMIVHETYIRDNIDQFANILYSVRDSEKLSALLLTVYERYYNLPLYYYVSGNFLALSEDHIGSIEQFQKIVTKDYPGEFDIAYIFVAHEYFNLKDTCTAIKACNLAIIKNYNDYRVWYSMGEIYASIEMNEYAMHFFRKCIELSPHEPGAYENFGQCFESIDKLQEASKCYKRGYEKGNTRCLSLLCNVLYKINDPMYIHYMEVYIDTAINKVHTQDDKEDVRLDDVEKYINILETTEGAKDVKKWREQLKVAQQSTML